MAKPKWNKFPRPDKAFTYAGATLEKHWARLHRGDCEPFPADAGVDDAWRAYHAGDFAKAFDLGLKAGGAGINAANKAAMIYANYLEEDEDAKLAIFQEIAARCVEQQRSDPKNANAWYYHAYALASLQPGNLDRQGAGPGPRRQDQEQPRQRAQARAQACRRAHRTRGMARGNHRQGGQHGRRPEQEHYKLVYSHVCSETGEMPFARVILNVAGIERKGEAGGGGPVDATFKAIESIAGSGAELLLYSVNAITTGTDAQGEVTTRLARGGRIVNGNGADTDIVIASARSYLNALNKLQSSREKVRAQGDV